MDDLPNAANLLILPTTHTFGENYIKHRWSAYKILVTVIGTALVICIFIAIPRNTNAFWFFQNATTYAQGINSIPASFNTDITTLHAATNINPHAGSNEVAIAITGGAAILGNVNPEGVSFNKITTHPTDGQISLYVVRPGDSLSEIAQMFGVSVNTILWANNITNRNIIKPGMTLTILPISGIRHIIKKGETLASIAKKYHGDINDIALYNNISPNTVITSGTTILIPGGEMVGTLHTVRGIYRRHHRITHAPSNPYRGGSGPAIPGFFGNPLPGGIITQGLHGWNAVDIGAPMWTRIHAAAPGIVIISRVGGWNGGYGNYVVINHGNGTQTLYAHMVRDISHVGERVSRGEVIGYVGMTGEATGPHLHFEVRGAYNPFVSCTVGRACYPKMLAH